ncbi:MAG: SCO family protein [Verrucomicrobia bacterium]|jgi:protein SCO1/2|nr:SCO family protein [Verrucomicrobiota bacterium]
MSDAKPRTGIPRLAWLAAFLAAAGLIALAYTSLKGTRPPAPSASLDRIAQVPPFELADQNGAAVTLDSLKGKIWVANFIFTRCKGPCPITAARMAELNTKLKKARDGVQLITFTVDPEYDTPPVLAQFGESLGADPAHWQFLTGTPAAINDVVVKGLLQPISREPDGTPAHSTRMVIVDGEGWLRSYHEGLDSEAVQKVMVDIGELLRESSPAQK